MTISSRPTDETLAARLLDVAPPPAPIDRHFYVPDNLDGAFCLACNLPRRNIRHVARPGGEAA